MTVLRLTHLWAHHMYGSVSALALPSSQPSASRSLQDCSDRASHLLSSVPQRTAPGLNGSSSTLDVGLGPTRSTAEPHGADFGRSGENFAESHGWRVREETSRSNAQTNARVALLRDVYFASKPVTLQDHETMRSSPTTQPECPHRWPETEHAR